MKKKLVTLLGSMALSAGSPLLAQEAPVQADPVSAPSEPSADSATIKLPADIKQAGAAPAANPSRVVEEIVVTAQKREENLQDVPISVSAFSGEELDARGVNDPTALAAVTPGLTYNTLVGYSLIYIRGIGSDAFEPTADASVATYIDGVYLPFAHGLAQEFVKLERIEVLKGPQGTLFGRNATGGAINIITKKPEDTFSGSFEGTGGNFSTGEGKAFITGPLLPHLDFSASMIFKRSDPYYKLEPTSPVQSFRVDKTRGLDAHLQWKPFDQFSVTLSELLTLSGGPGSIINQAQNPKPLGIALGIKGIDTPRETSLDYPPYLATNNHVYSGQVAWTPEWFDVKLLGSRQAVHTDLQYDFDSSPQPLVYFHATNQFSRVTTGELQLLSKHGGILPNWIETTAGLYYFHSNAGYSPVIFGVGSGLNPLFLPSGVVDPVLALLPPGLPIPTSGVNLTLYSTLKTEAEAGYLQTTVYPTDWFDITAGARYQHEKRGTTQADVFLTTSGPLIPALSFEPASVTRDDLSPKLTLDLKPWDGQLFYITASRASKSGTFNLPAIYTKPRFVKPETVTGYEAGNKGTLLNGQLRYAIAGFISQIQNLQTQIVSLQSGGAQNLVNADKARIHGVDFDTSWQALPNLLPGFVLKASGSYINGKYVSFPSGSGFDPTTGIFFGQGSLTLSPPRNFAGHQAVRTPKYSATISPNYATEVPGGTLEAVVDYYYNSGYFFDTQNTAKQPRYYTLDARLSYLYEPLGVRFSIFGKNLTNENYYLNQFPIDFATNSIYAAPRTFGGTLTYEFKS